MKRRSIGRRRVLAGAGGLLAAPAVVSAQGQTNGVALVIGNSKYQWEASLPNVRRDAPDVAKRFQGLGLKTELMQDVGRDAMRAAIDRFRASARGAKMAAFYFAGHGVSWSKESYIVPVDADLSDPRIVPSLVPVPSIGAAMAAAAHRLLVFDSCRNNPADGWRQVEAEREAFFYQGAGVAQPPDTLLLFSTAPGRVALDGQPGENSPFAAALLRQLENLTVDFQALAPKLRRDILIATQGRQVLWDQNTYSQPFTLPGGGRAAAAGGPPGWAGDPSRIVELPNAYAFVRQSRLFLPEGLIAHRAAAGTPHAQKIGSYKFDSVGGTNTAHPEVLIVMSVEEEKRAEIVVAAQNPVGTIWRFAYANLSNNRLDFYPRAGGPHYIFDWKDANSGGFSMIYEEGNNIRKGYYNSRFTRLDG